MAVLGTPLADQYDWPDDIEGEELVSAARTGPGYRQVAEILRRKITSGDYPPGKAFPGQGKIADDLEADVAVVNRAVAVLEQDGLLRVAGHGRRTIVLEQHQFRAEVAVAVTPVDEPRLVVVGGVADRLGDAVSDAVEADPRVANADLTVTAGRLTARMTVTGPDPAWAVSRASEIVRRAVDDTWDGRPAVAAMAWELGTARPA